MYIQVDIHELEPIVYKFPHQKLILGSAATSDLIIYEETVSKKHIKILLEGDSWYAVDQGSSNGSFISGEQLIPGERILIDFDTEIYLGNKVKIRLVEDAFSAIELSPPLLKKSVIIQNNDLSFTPEKTKLINLAEMRSHPPRHKEKGRIILSDLHKKKEENKTIKVENKKMKSVFLICLVVVGIGLYAHRRVQKSLKVSEDIDIVKKLKNKYQSDVEVESDGYLTRIAKIDLLSKVDLTTLLMLPKCDNPKTTKMCEHVTIKGIKENGVSITDNSIYVIFLDEETALENSKNVVPLKDKDDWSALKRWAFVHFFKEHMDSFKMPEASQIYVVLYTKDSRDVPTVSRVAAFHYAAIEMMKKNYAEGNDTTANSFYTFF